MKIKMGSKKSLIFVVVIAIILGVMFGLVLINEQKARVDKSYIDVQRQKLDTINKINNEIAENIINEENVDVETVPVESETLSVVPTMKDKIINNSAYCPTFQIVWNELSDMYLNGKKVIFLDGGIEFADNLNKREFDKRDLSDKYYYVKVGKQLLSTKNEIENGIKNKFNEKSDILNQIVWVEDSSVDIENFNSYVFYSMLKRNFKFEYPFDIITEEGAFKNYMNVKYFGIDKNSSENLRDQVEVLYHNDDSDFAVKLETKDDDEVILMKNSNDNFDTFEAVYNDLNKKEKKYTGEDDFEKNDTLSIPNLDFKVLKEYVELEGKSFIADNGEKIEISQALQTIDFSLDNEGGKLKSEAIIATKTLGIDILENSRRFDFNEDFYLFLKEDDKNKPYLAVKVSDISDFQKDAKEMRFYNGIDTQAEN